MLQALFGQINFIFMLLKTLYIFSVTFISAKIVSFEIPVDSILKQDWIYLTKFGGHIGKNNFRISMKLIGAKASQHMNLNFQVFIDEKWEKVLRTDKCQRAPLAFQKRNLDIENHQTNMTGQVGQAVRQHLWFFAVDGCNEFVKNKLKDIPEGKLQIDIRITNSNGSEFSSEETGIIYFIGFLSTVNTILLLYYYRILRLDEEKNEELNYPLAILVFSILLDNLRNYSYFVHLIAYAFNGFGITPLLLLSEICEVLSRITLTVLLIMFAWGWSIKYISILSSQKFVPIGVSLAQILMLGLSKISVDSYESYHQFDSWVGYGILLIEIGLFIYFQLGIEILKNEASFKLQQFLSLFQISCSFYFLSFPVLLLVSKVIAPYLRLKIIVSGTSIIRIGAVFFVGRLLTSKKSAFKDVSYRNVSILDRAKSE